MRTLVILLPLTLLLTACGSMRETASVRDDVYDIPDRKALLAAAAARDTEQQASQQQQDDYYDPNEAHDDPTRDYYDMTYNDPYYYNYGRFGFGTTISNYGPSYGMGLSYGWPTGFGSMSLGVGMGYGYYNPYDPYGYYGYGNYGYGYGGYGMGYGGYGPYQGPWAGYYIPPGYGYGATGDSYSSGVYYGHRPSISSGSGTSGGSPSTLRMFRGPVGLLQANGQPRQGSDMGSKRSPQPRTVTTPANSRRTGKDRNAVDGPAPNWGFGTGGGPTRSGGGDGGGGRISAPRPR